MITDNTTDEQLDVYEAFYKKGRYEHTTWETFVAGSLDEAIETAIKFEDGWDLYLIQKLTLKRGERPAVETVWD